VTTYNQLKKQIEALQVEAAKAKAHEVAGVVSRIKEAIATYSLTREDIFGGKAAKSPKTKVAAKAKSSTPKFADGKGGTWGGLGKRPQWLRDALAAGKKLEDFAVVQAAASEGTPAVAPSEAKAAPKKAVKSKFKPGKETVKYQDGTGNKWSGKGPRPKWFKEALAAGKTLEDLLAKG
jgi:DNA-binding protein H-NS